MNKRQAIRVDGQLVINYTVKAVADHFKRYFKDKNYNVTAEKQPQNFKNGTFYVRTVNTRQKWQMNNRARRHYLLEVRFTPAQNQQTGSVNKELNIVGEELITALSKIDLPAYIGLNGGIQMLPIKATEVDYIISEGICICLVGYTIEVNLEETGVPFKDLELDAEVKYKEE